MAVKCNIPNLALTSVHSLVYGFGCEDVTAKVVQNYLEYLKCSGVDYSFCSDFPCVAPGGDILCSIGDVELSPEDVTLTSFKVAITGTIIHPYTVQLYKLPSTLLDTKQSPVSPVSYTNLDGSGNYKVVLSLLCPGGETKIVELIVNLCVQVIDFEGEAEDVNDYI